MADADIWMPLYIGDYLAATAHLGATESGAYLHLLMHQWKNGRLPSDVEGLRRIAKVDKDAWSIAWALLESFFDHAQGFPVQMRMEEIREEWKAKQMKAKEKAEKAAAARWGKDAPSIPQAIPKQCPSSSSSPIKNSPIVFDGYMVSQAFLRSAGLSGSELARNISEAARAAIEGGMAGLDVLGVVEGSWCRWCAAKGAGKITATFGAEKFFGNGMWKDEAGWPWRNENGSNSQHQVKRTSPADDRGRESRANILKAATARYGPLPGFDDGAGAGCQAEPEASRGNAGHVAPAVGGNRAQIRPADISGRIIEGSQ